MRRFQFTRPSRKHRIGRAHVKVAMHNAIWVETRTQSWGDMGIFVGTDDRGLELEIGVIGADENVDLWLVMHVMPRRFRNE
ncbi:hypothetical protein JF780_05730 [Mycobacterium intracellulare]|uniref:hypothetical protein n=1 Tax=Mycobacterium intracellulare TaxID=1767 RepID=UPI001CDA30FE|nr:hypothetical protein [Mycobacterium intracellulare]MCA2275491.1 hypothetical protein [Mycobacterium intracellulare]MCA2324451.1 hypothetical protein [Mycobacterium intracellulare]